MALDDVENPLNTEEWPDMTVDIRARKLKHLFDGLSDMEIVDPGFGSISSELIQKFRSRKNVFEIAVQTEKGNYAVWPIWGYKHDGISFSYGEHVYPYTGKYDSGFVGTLAVKISEDGNTARQTAEAAIRRLNAWLDGEVYTYEIRKRTDGHSREVIYEDGGEYWGTDMVENGLFESVGCLSLGFTEALEAGTVAKARMIH